MNKTIDISSRTLREYATPILIGLGVVALVAVAIFVGVKIEQKNESDCREAGGHIMKDTDTSTGTGVDANGKVVTTTTTDTKYYCLNESGGIIWIR